MAFTQPKTGHCIFQIRPLRIELGQHLATRDGNEAGNAQLDPWRISPDSVPGLSRTLYVATIRPMIEGQLIARKVHDDPPSWRISFEDVEIGSISQQQRHTQNNAVCWHWGIDTMPLHGGRTPGGEAWSFEAAREAFRDAFFKWVNVLHPGDWQRNRDYIKARQRPSSLRT